MSHLVCKWRVIFTRRSCFKNFILYDLYDFIRQLSIFWIYEDLIFLTGVFYSDSFVFKAWAWRHRERDFANVSDFYRSLPFFRHSFFIILSSCTLRNEWSRVPGCFKNVSWSFSLKVSYGRKRLETNSWKRSRSRFRNESITASHRKLNYLPDESISFWLKNPWRDIIYILKIV